MDVIFEQIQTDPKDLTLELFSVWCIIFYFFCTSLLKTQNNLICKSRQINNFTVECSKHMCLRMCLSVQDLESFIVQYWATFNHKPL